METGRHRGKGAPQRRRRVKPPRASAKLARRFDVLTGSDADVLERLVTVGELRTTFLPALEADLVVAGRMAGITWQALADAAGVQRENLHRSYAHAVAARAAQEDAR
jgi:hypothetical protein